MPDGEHDSESSLRESIHQQGNRVSAVLLDMNGKIAEAHAVNLQKFATTDAAIENLSKLADKTEKLLTGNGHPEMGLVLQMSRLQGQMQHVLDTVAGLKKIGWIIVGSVLTSLIYSGMDRILARNVSSVSPTSHISGK